jgi:hypothetical protein
VRMILRSRSRTFRRRKKASDRTRRNVKIFWSWQSDTPGKIGRFLVRDALRDAIEQLKQSPEIEEPRREALHLDHDIQGVAGTPDLANTIFEKIDNSEVVLADVTLVGKVFPSGETGGETSDKKLINSNVGIELGYALRALTDRKVLLVFNEHYGRYEDLPFDLRHKGGSIVFNLVPTASAQEIQDQKKKLKERFIVALKPYLQKTTAVSPRPLSRRPLRHLSRQHIFNGTRPWRKLASILCSK